MNQYDPPSWSWIEAPHVERPTDEQSDLDSLIASLPEDDVVVQLVSAVEGMVA